jgi:hypothetical protein
VTVGESISLPAETEDVRNSFAAARAATNTPHPHSWAFEAGERRNQGAPVGVTSSPGRSSLVTGAFASSERQRGRRGNGKEAVSAADGAAAKGEG